MDHTPIGDESYEKLKECNECREEQPVSNFYRDVRCPDGRTRKCKTCRPGRKKKPVVADQTLEDLINKRVTEKLGYLRLEHEGSELSLYLGDVELSTIIIHTDGE